MKIINTQQKLDAKLSKVLEHLEDIDPMDVLLCASTFVTKCMEEAGVESIEIKVESKPVFESLGEI